MKIKFEVSEATTGMLKLTLAALQKEERWFKLQYKIIRELKKRKGE